MWHPHFPLDRVKKYLTLSEWPHRNRSSGGNHLWQCYHFWLIPVYEQLNKMSFAHYIRRKKSLTEYYSPVSYCMCWIFKLWLTLVTVFSPEMTSLINWVFYISSNLLCKHSFIHLLLELFLCGLFCIHVFNRAKTKQDCFCSSLVCCYLDVLGRSLVPDLSDLIN